MVQRGLAIAYTHVNHPPNQVKKAFQHSSEFTFSQFHPFTQEANTALISVTMDGSDLELDIYGIICMNPFLLLQEHLWLQEVDGT